MIVQVELKEKCDPFDFRTWNVPVPCGEGCQQIRWLAYAACARMALTTGDVATKFVPQVVKTPEGKILDANKMINEYIQDGSYIVIECSSGPKAFTIDWEGRKHETGTPTLSCVADTTTINGFLQALFIWYSCKGQELEDKDFGALNLAQFLQIFQDAMGKEFDGVLLENIFLDFLRINGKVGQYQLSISEFFSVLIHIAPGGAVDQRLSSSIFEPSAYAVHARFAGSFTKRLFGIAEWFQGNHGAVPKRL